MEADAAKLIGAGLATIALAGVQQNTGTVATGGTLRTYGVDVVAGRLTECTFAIATAAAGCAALPFVRLQRDRTRRAARRCGVLLRILRAQGRRRRTGRSRLSQRPQPAPGSARRHRVVVPELERALQQYSDHCTTNWPRSIRALPSSNRRVIAWRCICGPP